MTCGILAHGFARIRCGDCRQERLLAFNCKGRGICPSCTNRRMAEVAAHLCDRVIPAVPVRQWVLSVPKRLSPYLAGDAELSGAVLRIFVRGSSGVLDFRPATELDARAARDLTPIVQVRILRLCVRRGILTQAQAADMRGWRGDRTPVYHPSPGSSTVRTIRLRPRGRLSYPLRVRPDPV